MTLTWTDDEVLLDVRDDGVGFEVDAERASTSFGLRGMRQRAGRVAGRLDVESEPGGGTAVSLQVPAVGAAPGDAPVLPAPSTPADPPPAPTRDPQESPA
ncbi:MAG TPA: ATP-binding protein [Nocardioides sp.]